MTKQPHLPERWQWLLAELLDGQLTDEQAEELRTIVAADPAAREFYVRHILTHAMLQWEHAEPIVAGAAERGAVLPAGAAIASNGPAEEAESPAAHVPTTAPI